MYLAKSPSFLKLIYPQLTWHKSRSQKIVYLTFDDGPIPNVTSFVLNTLKNYDVQANFFCIGDNIIKHPEIFQAIKASGHRIGNHTFHHLNGWKTPTSTYLADVEKCQALTQSNLFRPPYGRIKKTQIKAILSKLSQNLPASQKPEIIMWDVLSADFDPRITAKTALNNVLNNVQNGSIIVFHDSLKAWDRLSVALPLCIAALKAQNYQFGLL
ncbi:MAG: polysaccharide deacetylase family protein [Pedobacter sp.]|nr:MAG: polysaccharide deacetylase family protein [Pedobacter sp.]